MLKVNRKIPQRDTLRNPYRKSRDNPRNNGWTITRRKEQAERCRCNKPWRKATGPRTKAGKERSRMNNYQHGFRSASMKEIYRLLRWQRSFVKQVEKSLSLQREAVKHSTACTSYIYKENLVSWCLGGKKSR